MLLRKRTISLSGIYLLKAISYVQVKLCDKQIEAMVKVRGRFVVGRYADPSERKFLMNKKGFTRIERICCIE